MLPLARAVTGQRLTPLYTTGPATRHALHSAGARGATTGSTMHLPEPPRPEPRALALLGHELAHVAESSPRPRFLLDSPPATGDEGERRARRLGEAVQAGALGKPVGPATAPPADIIAGGRVAHLPVGGAPAIAGAVRQAARDSNASLPEAGWPGVAIPSAATATAPPPLPATVGGPATATPATGDVAVAGWPGTAPAPRPSVAADPRADPTAPGAGLTTGAHLGHGQVSELLEALEERLLADIERRGGRYAGMF